jgi:hypothetical protein
MVLASFKPAVRGSNVNIHVIDNEELFFINIMRRTFGMFSFKSYCLVILIIADVVLPSIGRYVLRRWTPIPPTPTPWHSDLPYVRRTLRTTYVDLIVVYTTFRIARLTSPADTT